MYCSKPTNTSILCMQLVGQHNSHACRHTIVPSVVGQVHSCNPWTTTSLFLSPSKKILLCFSRSTSDRSLITKSWTIFLDHHQPILTKAWPWQSLDQPPIPGDAHDWLTMLTEEFTTVSLYVTREMTLDGDRTVECGWGSSHRWVGS
jgi:hypothetical protein